MCIKSSTSCFFIHVDLIQVDSLYLPQIKHLVVTIQQGDTCQLKGHICSYLISECANIGYILKHILGVLNSEESLIINSRLSQQKTNTNV